MKQRTPTDDEIIASAAIVRTVEMLLRITKGEAAITLVVQGDNALGDLRFSNDALRTRDLGQWSKTLANELRAYAAEIEANDGALLRRALASEPQ